MGFLIVEDPEPAPRSLNKLMCANGTHVTNSLVAQSRSLDPNGVETPLVTADEVGGQKWALWELAGGSKMVRLHRIGTLSLSSGFLTLSSG